MSVHVVGGLFTQELIGALKRGEEIPGLGANPLPPGDVAAAYELAREQWRVFQKKWAGLPEDASGKKAEGVSATRSFWVIPLFELMGYDLQYQRSVEGGGKSWPISHKADSKEGAPPVLVVAYDRDPFRADPSLGNRSPYGVMRDYLSLTSSPA
jgi:hypothetical protein